MRFSVAITHYNRWPLLKEAVVGVADDPRIAEIVIVDDASDDGSWEMIQSHYGADSKYRLFRNRWNKDCYANKAEAVRRCREPWVILFDSDNVMSRVYLDALEAVGERDRRWAYLPTFAEPEFDYRAFSGLLIDRGNVSQYMAKPMFPTALNTANYCVYRDEYLRVWRPEAKPETADSIFMNYEWLKAGNALKFVPDMRYFHRIHDGSHFQRKHNPRAEAFKRQIELKLEAMSAAA